jgi:hypothetical protein
MSCLPFPGSAARSDRRKQKIHGSVASRNSTTAGQPCDVTSQVVGQHFKSLLDEAAMTNSLAIISTRLTPEAKG